MKDRKNRAVFGLRTSVATPCHSGLGLAFCVTFGEISSALDFSLRASRIMRTPRKQRYAAPTYFTVAKAIADLARMIETPRAAAKTWTIPPRNVPKAERTPSRLPPA